MIVLSSISFQIAGSTLSAVGGPLLGLFMLGAFIPFATAKVNLHSKHIFTPPIKMALHSLMITNRTLFSIAFILLNPCHTTAAFSQRSRGI